MRKDSRLSRVLHVLAHLGASENPMTSSQLARMLCTNPVVVRRTMGLLRDSGYVQTVQGRHGGWSLTRPLSDMTLLEIHKALGDTGLIGLSVTSEHGNCFIEKSVNLALTSVFNEAETLILARFGEISLDKLLQRRD
ncbi:Rrf2 family transcriptional regulator [Bowmanella dokdonensis]|uniref:Rrf2 family transcriptional regulator n=1 Tax=Bowmanella dokdonensis TaxID=751969 RepID=A0A939ITD4_9ALTE|nr:Rrf2 family transcriptional regulator [Bowmanella dokdonensis]